MRANVDDIDHVFNFFVTAYHIIDYVRKAEAVPQHFIDTFAADQDIKDCRDACDKGKHLKLTKPGRVDPDMDPQHGAAFAADAFATEAWSRDAWNMGERALLSEDRVVPVEALADRVMKKWDTFFAEHGL
jgi:hypothetical protein